MKRGSTIFLQIVIVLIGMGTLALMLWFPHIEGRNANATWFEVYFKDPFLAYVYVASLAYFTALYQACKVLVLARHNRVFSQEAVNALRSIKYCAMAIVGFVAVALVIILLNDSEDRAGGVFMGIVVTFGSIVIATAAAKFERFLQRVVGTKSESDFMV